ncbi:MAG: CaiB/BaiF CoA-transferase family protein [Chloroflexi bacterium]|nr:CaiB/BaiF CoA-transferase family protein [Chloroflexota bacterium]
MTTDNHLLPPLDGIVVINAGQILAAPHCATMLAEFGADVIKVERPGTGEPNHGTISYVQENRSQRGVTCNLADPRGKDLFRRLCERADVLIENFRPGTLEKMDLAPDSLRELNPGLVVTRVSGFGQTGPYRERAGFDRVALGFAGMTYTTGWADGPPVRPGYMVADYSAGVFAAMGTLMALRARDVNGGAGQDVDVALYEAIWKQSGTHASQFFLTGENRERSGNYWPGVVPAEQWQTADAHHLIINATTQGTFVRLVEAMQRPDLLTDERFEVHRDRRRNYESLHEIVGEWIGSMTLEQVQHLLDKCGVPATKVYATSDVMGDEHYQAREQIVDVPSEQHGDLPQPGITPRLSKTPGAVKHRAPTLGEHNREIYGEMLGVSDEDLVELSADGVI